MEDNSNQNGAYPPPGQMPVSPPNPQTMQTPQNPVVPQQPMQPQQPLQPQAVTPEPVNPQVMQNNDVAIAEPKKRRARKMFLIILSIFILLFVGLAGVFGLGVAIAYERVNIGSEGLRTTLRQTIVGLPFMPKTPRYILEKTLIAHSDLKSHYFDASLAMESDSLASQFGYSQIDAKAAGNVDYNDINNIKLDLDVSVTKDFNAFLKLLDQNLYLKVNKLPQVVTSLVGISSEQVDEIFADWIVFDITPLESNARDLLDENKEESGSATNKIVENMVEELMDEYILSQLTVTEDSYNEVPVYTIKFTADAEDLDYIQKKFEEEQGDAYFDDTPLREIVEKLELEVKVGRQDGLVRWASVVTDINTESQSNTYLSIASPYVGQVEKFSAVFVLSLDKFNQNFEFSAPESSIDFETFMKKAEEAIYKDIDIAGPYWNENNQTAQARDTQRRSDLLQITNAIYQFAAEHEGNLPDTDNNDLTSNFPTSPTCIGTANGCFDLASAGGEDSLVPTYIASIPADPITGISADTGYTIYLDGNGRVVASASGELAPSITVQR